MKPTAPPPALDALRAQEAEMIEIRREIHAQPELAYEEHVTSALVAERLERWGWEVHRGLGGTGVVGTLRHGSSPRRIGIRADMDALPVQETSGKPWASKVFGKMHACGHDGHTAMLLSAARHLAATRQFDGTVHVVFQPAEEGGGGARRMIEEGFFDLFPCDAMFAMHNVPGLPEGRFSIVAGPAMASADTCIIRVHGKGTHAAMPQAGVDTVLVTASIVVALQSIVSRNLHPLEMGVVTVGAMQAGHAPNVIPAEGELRLSVRAYTPAVRDLLERRIAEVAQAQASVFGASAEVDYQHRYPVVMNDADQAALCRRVVTDWCGEDGLIQNPQPVPGSDDFAFFLERVPGCYLFMGSGEDQWGDCMLHNPGYDFNDRVLSTGASLWVRLAETALPSTQPLQASTPRAAGSADL